MPAVPAVLVGVALVAAGCGGGGSSGSATPPSSTPTSASSPSAPSSGPTVRPASGRKVDLAAFTARTPRGFDYDNSLAKEIVFSASRGYGTEVTYSDIAVFPGAGNAFLARLSIKNSDWHPKPTVADPVTFAGTRWYHLTGPIGEGQHLEEFGTVVPGASAPRLVKVSFAMKGSAASRKKLVDSVLATVRLK